MRPSSRVALALSATAVLAVFTGCGTTLYDAVGVPQLVLQCTNPQVPVACAVGCVAESDVSCGKSCLDCVGDAAASADANAVNACDRSSAAISGHVCDFTCPTGMQKDLVNKRCACTAATQVRCVGSNACIDQGPTLCGDACEDCTKRVLPAHASATCNDAARQCDFACDAGSGFAKDALGDRCVCGDATKVSCGGGVPGGACVAEGATACSDACVDCTNQAQFKVNLTNVAAATIACNTQVSVHQCDWSCPPASDLTLTEKFTNASGQADCQVPTLKCGGGQHKCPTSPTANACFATDDLNHCGLTACNDCANAATNVIPGNGAVAACLSIGAGDFSCGFTCPAGTLKSGAGPNGACVQVSPLRGSVAVGGNHTCAITTLGDLMCWGLNAAGQLGLAPGADQLTPAAVGLANVQYVAAAGDRTCAVIAGLPGGNVRCWGGGSATLVDPGVTGATAVAVGTAHACAIVAGGGVVCWGANDKGQAGNGGIASPVTTPTVVRTATANLGGMTRISSSADHTCAIDTVAGAVYCWGANGKGQVGVSPASAAVPNATLIISSQATDVAAGGSHSCAASPTKDAVNKDGDSKCWGDDTLAQLGNKPTTPVVSPALVFADQLDHLADLVAAGRNHTCNTRSADVNPALLCSGANDLWQAGGPPPPAPQLPFTVKGPDLGFLTQITVLVSGGDHTCVVTVTGEMKCWGSNAHGQLGIGSTANSAAPVSPSPQ